MRDVLVTAIVFLSLPYIVARPYVGIYMWTWIGLMNPHRLSWGFAYEMPFAFMVAIATVIGIVLSNKPKQVPRDTLIYLWALFILWMLFTTFFAPDLQDSWSQMAKVAKIQFMVFLTIMLINTKERITSLVWIIVLSLGFYGVKGGIFTITHGGVFQIRGPLGTFIGGNNEIALALIMTVPLMRYLQMQAERIWVKHGLTAAMGLTGVAIIGSHSRGALVGVAVMTLFLWLKGRQKFFMGFLIAASVIFVVQFMPDTWFDRMRTIQDYDQDASALGRINAWGMALNLAKDHPFVGGGFHAFTEENFARYARDAEDLHDSHSIYFEMLGEHGFVGLALFLALGIATWRAASKIMRATAKDPERKWMSDLAAMVQVSILGYAACGTFLGLAYFDFYYILISVIVILKCLSLSGSGAQLDTVPKSWLRSREIAVPRDYL